MNETFNSRRFGLLFKKTLLEQPLQTFGVLGIAVFVTLLMYKPYEIQRASEYAFIENLGTFRTVVVLSGICLNFFMFSHFSENAKGYSYLLLPTSYFEKWLCGFLLPLFLILGIYLVFYRLIDSISVHSFFNELANKKDLKPLRRENLVKCAKLLAFDSFEFWDIIKLMFIAAGLTAVGSLYFKKNGVVKICFMLLVLAWSYASLNGYIFKLFFTENDLVVSSFGNIRLQQGGIIALPEAYAGIINTLFYYCFPAALWLIVLIRLREKEI